MTVLRSGSATDVGRVRQSNQDVALEETDLFAVADGMGGHVGGEVAARVAVDALRESFRRDPSVEGLRRAVAGANEAVWRRSQDQTGLRGMGTTLTATALVTDQDGRKIIALANVGDSRAYVYTRGRAIQVTADHSLAEEKVRQGELTEAEAAIHPHRHILTRALGVASDVDVDLWELHLHEGDRVLLCSDGLTNEVNDGQISDALGSVPDPTDAAQTLVDAAVAHGGNDNVTVVVVDVLSADNRLVSSTGARRHRPARVPRLDGTAPDRAVASGAVAAGAGDGLDAPAEAGGEEVIGGRPDGGGPDRIATEPPGGKGSAPDELTDGIGEAGQAGGIGAVQADSTSRSGASTSRSGASTSRSGASTSRSGTATATAERTVPRERHGERHGGVREDDGGDLTGAVPVVGGYAPTGPYRPPLGEVARARRTRHERHERREHRRASRWLTVRFVLFLILVTAVLAAGYGFVRWYANDNWYVGLDGTHLAVYQGYPGGLLWYRPKLVDLTAVTTATIVPTRLTTIRRDVNEPSLAAATRYVDNLHEEYLSVQRLRNGSATSPAGAAPGLGK